MLSFFYSITEGLSTTCTKALKIISTEMTSSCYINNYGTTASKPTILCIYDSFNTHMHASCNHQFTAMYITAVVVVVNKSLLKHLY